MIKQNQWVCSICLYIERRGEGVREGEWKGGRGRPERVRGGKNTQPYNSHLASFSEIKPANQKQGEPESTPSCVWVSKSKRMGLGMDDISRVAMTP